MSNKEKNQKQYEAEALENLTEVEEIDESDADLFDLTSTSDSLSEDSQSSTATKVAVLPKKYTDLYSKKNEPKKKDWFEPAGYTETVSTVHSILKTVAYIVTITLVGCFLAYFAITRINDLYAFVKPDDEVEITIPDNATVNEITDILYDAGIIEYPSFFKLYAELKNASERYEFKVGSYVVNPMMNYDELFIVLEGTVERTVKRITIPEGYSVEEIIDLFVSEGLGTKEGFENVIQNYDFEYDFIAELDSKDYTKRKYRLEGYLYPDTYEVYTNKSEAYYIYKLLDRFNELFSEKYRERAEALGYTMDEIVTLASIIEKEGSNPADFETISSVFHNRLKDPRYPKFESCATIVYAIQMDTGVHIQKVTAKEQDYESPYNTYKYEGFPPGPISCPGYEAITCALYPEKSSYFYFVSSIEGETFFAKTLSEHNNNIAKVDQLDKEYLEGLGE